MRQTFRLVAGAALAAAFLAALSYAGEAEPQKAEAPAEFLAYDFGTATALPGFAAVTGPGAIQFDGNVKFAGDDYPDPLIGDYVEADAMTVTIPGLAKAKYRLAVIAQNTVRLEDAVAMLPAEDFSVSANGKAVADVKITPEWFFSQDGLYYGVQFDDLPGTDWWTRYVKPAAPWRKGEFDSNGSLKVDLKRCRLFALVIAKADEVGEKEFDGYLEKVDAARKAHFLGNKFKLETKPPDGAIAVTPEEEARGCVVFSRYFGEDVSYYSVPKEAERVARIAVSGTPGERVPVTFSIRTLRAVNGINVAVSDLVDAEKKTVPSAATSVQAVRYKLRRLRGEEGPRFDILPDVIQAQANVDLPAEITKTWWLTVNVPPDAAAGVYSGTITLKLSDAPAAMIPLQLEVYPFTLAAPAASIGLWYEDPSRLGYNTGLLGGVSNKYPRDGVPPEISERDRKVEAFRVAMLGADLKSLAEHGFNAITVPGPRILSISERGDATLSFSLEDAYGPLLRNHRINTDYAGQTFLLTLAMQMTAIRVDGEPIPEYTDLHATAFKSAAAEVRDYWRRERVKLLAFVVDEPREREINEWNRNLEGTLYYLRLLKEMGDWPSTVTTMRDVQDGVSYMPILEAEDVVQPHPSVNDKDSVAYAREYGKPLWYFNGSGFRRYPFGFYIWSQAPEGYWQWHYDFWNFPFNAVWEAEVGYTTYPSPNGPLATPGYERSAQGILDYRYALTLESEIARAEASNVAEAAKAAAEARGFLDDIRKNCTPWVLDENWKPMGVPDATLVEWRAGIVRHILKLRALQKGPEVPAGK